VEILAEIPPGRTASCLQTDMTTSRQTPGPSLLALAQPPAPQSPPTGLFQAILRAACAAASDEPVSATRPDPE
jgi:hypothetical protein